MCSNSWKGDANILQFVTKVAQNGLSEASKKAPFWTFWSIPDPLHWNFSNIHVLHMTLEYLYPSCKIREEELVVIFKKIVFAALGSALHFRLRISGFCCISASTGPIAPISRHRSSNEGMRNRMSYSNKSLLHFLKVRKTGQNRSIWVARYPTPTKG